MIEIRPIREDDVEGFYAAFSSVIAERTFLAFLRPPPIESTRAYIGNAVARRYPFCVAVDSGQVVGWCDVIPESRDSQRHIGGLGIGLIAERRGHGIGDQLIARTLEAARAFGLARVALRVRATNQPARRLYEKHGFHLEGRERKAMLVDGVYDDIEIMALLFEDERPFTPA